METYSSENATQHDLLEEYTDEDLKALVQIGVLSTNLNLSSLTFVINFLIKKFKKELGEAAREKIAQLEKKAE